MFESLVSGLLTQYLGEYIKDVDPNQLRIGIFGGDVVLENLEVKKEALDALDLPITVNGGFIGKLVLKADWKNLGGKPVVASLERIFLLAGPKEAEPYDAKDEATKADAAKQSKLTALEAQKEAAANSGAGPAEDDDSFTTRLITKIVDNVQVNIDKLHIRYEDHVPDCDSVFAAGITLESLSLRSTDKDWKPTFLTDTKAKLVHKLAGLKNLAIYWDPESASLAGLSVPDMNAEFDKLIHTDRRPVNHAYILEPVSGQAKIIMCKTLNDMNHPKVVVDLQLGEINFRLEEAQYADMMDMLDLFSRYNRGVKYRKFRPQVSVSEDPLAWFRYAANATLSDIQERNNKWRPSYFAQRRSDRNEYVRLWKMKKMAKKALDERAAKTLEILESRLSFEDIKFFRQLAELEVKEELARRPPEPEKAAGWFGGWGWGGGKKAKDEAATAAAAQASLEITDEQRAFLYSQIEYKEDEVVEEAPPEYVSMQVNLSIAAVAFALSASARAAGVPGKDLIGATLGGLGVGFIQRSTSMKVNVTLDTLEVEDKVTPNTVHPLIVAPKAEVAESSSNLLTLTSKAKVSNPDDALFALTFEQNPLDGHADSDVQVSLKPLEIVYVPKCIEAITGFFAAETNDAAVGDISAAASAQAESLRLAGTANLKHVAETRTKMDLKVDLKAPHILIPEDATRRDSPLLIVDLGRLLVHSDFSNLNEDEPPHDIREEEMYDNLQVTLHSVQVLVAPGASMWMSAQSHKTSPLHVIEKFNISLLVQNCALPNDPRYTQTKLSGDLDSLRLHVSTMKTRRLLEIVNAVTASDDPDADLVDDGTDEFGADDAANAASGSNEADDVIAALEEVDDEKKLAGYISDLRLLVEREVLKVNFEIKEVVLTITHDYEVAEPEDVLRLVVRSIGTEFIQRTYDMEVKLEIAAFEAEDLFQTYGDEYRYFIRSELDDTIADAAAAASDKLISVRYLAADKNAPAFTKFYDCVETLIELEFGQLHVSLNPLTVKALLGFSSHAFPPPPDPAATKKLRAAAGPSKPLEEVYDPNSRMARRDAKRAEIREARLRKLREKRAAEAARKAAAEAAGEGEGGESRASGWLTAVGGATDVGSEENQRRKRQAEKWRRQHRRRNRALSRASSRANSRANSRASSPQHLGASDLGSTPESVMSADDFFSASEGDDDDYGNDVDGGSDLTLVTMKISAKIAAVAVSINRPGSHVAALAIGGLEVGFVQFPGTMKIHAEIGSINLRDLTAAGEMYRDVIDIAGERMVVVDFATFDAGGDDYPGHDMDVKARIEKIQVLFLNRFITDLLNYNTYDVADMLAPLEDATAAASASAAAAASGDGDGADGADGAGSGGSHAARSGGKGKGDGEGSDEDLFFATDDNSGTFAGKPTVGDSDSDSDDDGEGGKDEIGAKIKLDVVVSAPSIIVPRDSHSEQVLVVDLGKITILNELGVASDGSTPIDSITAAIANLNLRTGVSSNPELDEKVLQDTYLDAKVVRSLQPSRTHVPGLSVSGALPKLALTLTRAQYEFLLSIADTNLGEEPEMTPEAAAAAAKAKKEAEKKAKEQAREARRKKKAEEQRKREQAEASAVPVIAIDDSAAPYATMVVRYRLGEMSLKIFTPNGGGGGGSGTKALTDGSSGSGSGSGSGPAKYDGLAGLSFKEIVVPFDQFSDGAMAADVTMDALSIVDLRPENSSVFGEIVGHGDHGREKQLELSYKADAAGNMDVKLILDSPRGVIVFDVLYAILDFVTPPAAPAAGDDAAAVPAITDGSDTGAAAGSGSGVGAGDGGSAGGTGEGDGGEEDSEGEFVDAADSELEDEDSDDDDDDDGASGPQPTMNVSVGLLNPEFCLVEDPTKESSRAFILDFSVDLTYVTTPEGGQNVDATISQMEIVKCFMDHRELSTDLIRPFNLTANYCVTPADSGAGATDGATAVPGGSAPAPIFDTSVTAKMDDVDVRISYQDVKLALHILELASPPAADEGDAEAAAKEEERKAIEEAETDGTADDGGDNDDGFVDDEDLAELAATAAAAKAEGGGKGGKGKGKKGKGGEDAEVGDEPSTEAGDVADELEDEEIDIPEVPRGAESADVEFGALRLVLINDQQVGQATPVVEMRVSELAATAADWSGDLQATAALTLNADYYNNKISSWEPMLEDWTLRAGARIVQDPYRMDLDIASYDVFNLNVTHAFVEALYLTSYLLVDDYSRGNDEDAPVYTPYKIRNETGHKVRYWLSPEDVRMIDTWQEVPFNFEDSTGADTAESRTHDARTEEPHYIVVQMAGGFAPVVRIPVDRVGKTAHTLSPRVHNLDHRLVCEVELVNNTKVLTLRSTVWLVNNTELPLEIRLDAGDIEPTRLETLQPGAASAVPVFLAYQARIRVRPLNCNTTWSDVDLSWHGAESGSSLLLHCPDKDAVDSGSGGGGGGGGKSKGKDKGKDKGKGKGGAKGKGPGGRRAVERANGYAIGVKVEAEDYEPAEFVYPAHTFSFFTPVKLVNGLPKRLGIDLCGGDGAVISTHDLASEGECAVFAANPSDMVTMTAYVEGYECTEPAVLFNGGAGILGGSADKTISLDDGSGRILRLAIDRMTEEDGSTTVTVYAPFLMVNKTGMPLSYATAAGLGKKPVPAAGVPEEGIAPGDEPFLFAYASKDLFGNKAVVQVMGDGSNKFPASQWSSGFSLETAGSTGALDIGTDAGANGPSYSVGVRISLNAGNMALSKTITFIPQLVLVSHMTNDTLLVRQTGAAKGSAPLRLEPGQRLPYHWPAGGKSDRHSIVALDKGDGEPFWSNPFNILELGSVGVRLNDDELHPAILPIEVKLIGSATYVLFTDMDEANPPFKIINNSNELVTYYQTKTQVQRTLPHGTTVGYTWDDLAGKKTVKIGFGEGKNYTETEVSISEIGDLESVRVPLGGGEFHKIILDVVPRGGSRVLRLRDNRVLVARRKKQKKKRQAAKKARKKAAKAARKRRKAEAAAAAAAGEGGEGGSGPDKGKGKAEDTKKKGGAGEEEEEEDDDTNMCVIVKLKGFGISIVDAKPQELLYLSIMDMNAKYSTTDKRENIAFAMSHFQIDNQLATAEYPVLLGPKPTTETNAFVKLSVVRDLEETSIDYYHYFSVLIQEIDIMMEEKLLYAILGFVTSMPEPLAADGGKAIADSDGAASSGAGGAGDAGGDKAGDKGGEDKGKTPATQTDSGEADAATATNNDPTIELAATEDPAGTVTRKMYFDLLTINPIAINLTFTSSSQSADDEAPKAGALGSVFRGLGVTLANLDNVPLRLRALVLTNPFATQDELVGLVTAHYTQQAIQEAYKIVGSFDFLGNPVGLFANVGTGVMDFFYEPAKGIVESPQAFAVGLGKGTSSLLKNSLFGVFNTASKLTGTAGKGLTMLTMDDDYIASRDRQMHGRPAHAGEGLYMGVQGLGKGLFDGVTGLVTQPVKGAQEEGALGFAKGVGKGLVGVVLKPTVGVVDLATKTTEGIRNTTTYFDEKSYRVRPPRFIGPTKVLRNYDLAAAFGQDLLWSVKDGRFVKSDYYVCHAPVVGQHEDDAFVVSSSHALLMRMDSHSLVWCVTLASVTDVSARGVKGIHLAMTPHMTVLGQSPTEQSLEFPDKDIRDWLYDLLVRAHRVAVERGSGAAAAIRGSKVSTSISS